MNLNVRLFATLRECVKAPEVVVEVAESASVADLLSSLCLSFPTIEPSLDTILIAVNGEYVDYAQTLSATDEVALFPPVSGG